MDETYIVSILVPIFSITFEILPTKPLAVFCLIIIT